jgi:Na+/melibiose symporter-like transporter
MMMSVIPAVISVITAGFVWLYPLTTKRVNEIVEALKVERANKN